MAADGNYVHQILQSNQYKDITKTKKDINEALRMYKGLKPVSDRFVFNNGTQKSLLSLTGTIPIRYKGSSYNIPVVIWLLDTHPVNAPMVFVKPTPDMRIKVSRHVDHNGKVYLPYLHEWTGASSDLLALIQVLVCTFSEQPPVYAVPPQQQQPQGMPTPYGTPYPVQTPYPAMPNAMPMPPTAGPGQSPVNQGSMGTLAPSLVRSSLISAVEEKIRRRMDDQYLGAEIMRGTAKQLEDGRDKLERMTRDLTEEKTNLEHSMELCRQECKALEEEITRAKEIENEPDIDSAITPPAPLYRQIVDSFVKDMAMEDTIYYLGDALRKEKIDIDQFLKHVRQISRKQFKERALLNKCRQKAGLPG